MIKVGYAFSDSIYSQKSPFFKGFKKNYGFGDEVHMRTILLPLLLILAVGGLLVRLFFLQVIQGDSYRALSDSNRTRTTRIHAPRGIIFDRNGIPLVYNLPGFRQVVNGKTQFVSRDDALSLLAQGKNLEIDSLRYYPFTASFAHVVGYLGQITPDQLQEPEFGNYASSDVVGEMGIEQSYESTLRGIDGEKLVEVDATGKSVKTLGQTDPVAGQNITLTLDSKLQQVAYQALADHPKGAVIASKPDGEILAMVSAPSFDPNLFTMGKSYMASPSGYTNVSQILLDNSGQPLLNRAIGGVYPPGSTFKLVMAAAGLQTKTIDSNFIVQDNGVLNVGPFSFSNWYYTQYGKTEGPVDVVKAIKRSNDIFFYTLGEKLGVDTIAWFGQKFSLGQKLGIDVAGERSGLLPTKQWKQQTLHEQWYLGDDYHLGIGQGYLLTTPLQVNGWTQALANNGTLFQPHMVLTTKPKIISSNIISSQNMDIIRQGMIEACQPGGVAYPLFNFHVHNARLLPKIDGQDFLSPIQATGSAALTSSDVGVSIACKTGTAQHGDENTMPHAWITLFAPAYHPQIVVTVLVESSGEGSDIAAPIAKKVLEAYFAEK